MFCPKCGREIPEGTVCSCEYQQPLSSNPALHVIKSLGSSKLFLAMAICCTLSVVLSILSNLFTSTDAVEYLNQLMGELGSDVSSFLPSGGITAVATAQSIGSIVVSGVISAIYVVPFWLHYHTCKDRATGNIKTGGLTIWKVITWISIIGYVIASLCVLLIAVVFTYLGFTLSESPDAAVVLAVVGVAVIFIAAFFGIGIACQITKLRLINRTLKTAATGFADSRVSSFLITITYIWAVFTAISGLGSLIFSPFGGLTSLAEAAQMFITGNLLSRYKKAMIPVQHPQSYPQM